MPYNLHKFLLSVMHIFIISKGYKHLLLLSLQVQASDKMNSHSLVIKDPHPVNQGVKVLLWALSATGDIRTASGHNCSPVFEYGAHVIQNQLNHKMQAKTSDHDVADDHLQDTHVTHR